VIGLSPLALPKSRLRDFWHWELEQKKKGGGTVRQRIDGLGMGGGAQGKEGASKKFETCNKFSKTKTTSGSGVTIVISALCTVTGAIQRRANKWF